MTGSSSLPGPNTTTDVVFLNDDMMVTDFGSYTFDCSTFLPALPVHELPDCQHWTFQTADLGNSINEFAMLVVYLECLEVRIYSCLSAVEALKLLSTLGLQESLSDGAFACCRWRKSAMNSDTIVDPEIDGDAGLLCFDAIVAITLNRALYSGTLAFWIRMAFHDMLVSRTAPCSPDSALSDSSLTNAINLAEQVFITGVSGSSCSDLDVSTVTHVEVLKYLRLPGSEAPPTSVVPQFARHAKGAAMYDSFNRFHWTNEIAQSESPQRFLPMQEKTYSIATLVNNCFCMAQVPAPWGMRMIYLQVGCSRVQHRMASTLQVKYGSFTKAFYESPTVFWVCWESED
jgi:hypothetical protein